MVFHEDARAFADALGISYEEIRPSSYAGMEIVLSWTPFACITLCGGRFMGYYAYSRTPFPGATYNGMGDWEMIL